MRGSEAQAGRGSQPQSRVEREYDVGRIVDVRGKEYNAQNRKAEKY